MPGEYLLEVRSEEIPARMLEPGMRELATRLFEELMARGMAPREVATGFTPRRLTLVLSGLPEREPDREEQVMGPPVRAAYAADGAPTPALTGFAKRCGVAPEALRRVATDKGEYLAAVRKTAGRPAAEVLAELVPRALAGISWAKTMRWGSGDGPWVRPVHGLVSLLDGAVVPSRSSASRPATRQRGTRSSPPRRSPSPTPRAIAASSARATSRCGRASGGGSSPRPCASAPRPWAAGWSTTRRCSTSWRPSARSPASSKGASTTPSSSCRPRCCRPACATTRARSPSRTPRARACCPISSPSWTGRTTRRGGRARATSGWWRRAWPTPASSTARTGRPGSPAASSSSSASPSTSGWGAMPRSPRAWPPSPARSATPSAGRPRGGTRSRPRACSRSTWRPRWSRSSPPSRG